MTHERKGNFLKHGEIWLYRGEKEQWEEYEKRQKEVVLKEEKCWGE